MNGQNPFEAMAAFGAMQPVPAHADRDQPLERPDLDPYPKECPECGATGDPWVGDNVVAVGIDITIVDDEPALMLSAECTCGWAETNRLQ